MADVVMPQMGESIAEGTIVRWIKKIGDTVERDEPLFEISTDKVDAEIPSPVAGVLTEIRHAEGETVPVNSVVAIIGPAGSQPAVSASPAASIAPVPVAAQSNASKLFAPAPADQPASTDANQRSSPLVRRLAAEHNVDLGQVKGTGLGGRVTKDDVLAFVADHSGTRPSAPSTGPGKLEPMSVMRKKIAEHMVESRRTSAHVHSVFEVNFSRVTQIRSAKKAAYEKEGTKLTYLSFIVKAAADALRAVPVLNASVEGDSIRYHDDVNIGIAVSLDWGLIVPVIRNADQKHLLDVSREIVDLADRARQKHLKPEEVLHGTFTVTNPGALGAQFGLPIINQPQVAILGIGNIEKRPVVVNDAIVIGTMAYLALGYDHRIVDGAVGDQFMATVKHALETWDPGAA